MNNQTNMKTESLIVGGMALVTLVTGAILSSVSVGAETDAVDEINITVPSACTMSGNIATGQEHTASVNPNTYQDNIGKTTITAYCNDVGGYAIYAIGFTGDRYIGEDHTKLIGTNTSQKISTGTGQTGNSQWAMKLSAVAGAYAPTISDGTNDTEDFTDYHVVPDIYTKVATFGNSTDAGENATGSSLETTYAAYISGTQAADTYMGKVKYTLVHPSTEPAPVTPQVTTTGKIHYYPNAYDTEGTMGEQNIASSVTLLASNFSRTGYGFAGWNTEFDYSGTFYGPNETISINTADYTGDNNGLSLYAVWVKSQGSLQDSSKVASVCSNLTQAPIDGTANLSSVSALTDQRDNNTYAIAKLADGKCWMIENMRLADKGSSNNDIELSSTNTNNPSLPITNVYDASNPTTSNHLSPSVDPTTTTWCTSNSAACYDQSMLYTGNTTDRASSPSTSDNTYSYGNYYNWYSATAGNGKYTNDSGYTAPGDICPTGWTLPTSGSASMDYGVLDIALGGTGTTSDSSSTPTGATMSIKYRSYPNNFIFSGYIYGSPVTLRGSNGDYWSKSGLSNVNAHRLGIGISYVSPFTINSSGSYDKNLGFSVRCLAQ